VHTCVCVFVYVYMCACIRECAHVCMCLYAYVCACVLVCLCVCVYLRVYVCLCVACVCKCICVCFCVCVCMCVCVGIHHRYAHDCNRSFVLCDHSNPTNHSSNLFDIFTIAATPCEPIHELNDPHAPQSTPLAYYPDLSNLAGKEGMLWFRVTVHVYT